MLDPPVFYSEKTIVARKKHRCYETGCKRWSNRIVPGEPYQRVTGKWDDFCTFAFCLRCAALRKKVLKKYPDAWEDGLVFGGLLEYVREARRW